MAIGTSASAAPSRRRATDFGRQRQFLSAQNANGSQAATPTKRVAAARPAKAEPGTILSFSRQRNDRATRSRNKASEYMATPKEAVGKTSRVIVEVRATSRPASALTSRKKTTR